MSNQFPPAGNGQPGQNQNLNGDQSNSGYGASTPGYQGYQPQSGYGSYGDQGQQAQPGYGSYGDQSSQGQQAQPGYGSYGDQGQQGAQSQQGYGVYGDQGQQPGYGSYGDQSSQASQQNYGGYGQHDAQAPAYGSGYGQQPPQGGKKKTAPWVWIVVALAAIALVVGGVFGAMALFGGGGKYTLNAETGIDGVTMKYVGSDLQASEYGGGSDESFNVMDDDYQCMAAGALQPFDKSELDGKSVEDAIMEEIDDQSNIPEGIEAKADGTITIEDTEGQSVEFQIIQMKGESDGISGEIYVAMHLFPESGDALMFMAGCQSGYGSSGDAPAYSKGDFEDFMKNDVEFTLKEQD